MKKKIKFFGITAFAAVLIFPMLTCNNGNGHHDDDDNDPVIESPHQGERFAVTDEQLWDHNDATDRISNAYFESQRNGTINIFCRDEKFLSEGTVNAGKISFTLDEPEKLYPIGNTVFDSDLHDWWENVKIIEPPGNTIRGNAVKGMYFHDADDVPGETRLIMKEKLVGTSTSLALEFSVFIYVNDDCRITGEPKDGMVPGTGYFHSEPLDITLKQGWNMVCRVIRYSVTGLAVDMPIEVKNLVDFKWALWEDHPYVD